LYTEEKLHNNPEGKALLLFDVCFFCCSWSQNFHRHTHAHDGMQT